MSHYQECVMLRAQLAQERADNPNRPAADREYWKRSFVYWTAVVERENGK